MTSLIRRFREVNNLEEVKVHSRPQNPPEPSWIQKAVSTSLKVAKCAAIALVAGAAAYAAYTYFYAPSSTPVLDQLAHVGEDSDVQYQAEGCPIAQQSPWTMIRAMGSRVTSGWGGAQVEHQYAHDQGKCDSSDWSISSLNTHLEKKNNQFHFSSYAGRREEMNIHVSCETEQDTLHCYGIIGNAQYKATETSQRIVELVCEGLGGCISRVGNAPAYLMTALQRVKESLLPHSENHVWGDRI